MSTYQSRWGYHPCDFPTYLMLKAINKVVLLHLRQQAAWERWDRKMPHNRIYRSKLRNNSGQVVGFGLPVPRPEPEVTLSFLPPKARLVPEVYRWARRPAPTPEAVERMKLTVEDIRHLHEKLCTI